MFSLRAIVILSANGKTECGIQGVQACCADGLFDLAVAERYAREPTAIVRGPRSRG